MRNVAKARVTGPFGELAEGFRAELDRLGYTPKSREFKLRQVSRFSGWLESQGLGVGDVDSARVEAFLVDLGRARRQMRSARSLRPLMEWLRAQGIMGEEPPAERSAVEDLVERYHAWMLGERGLAPRTIGRYEVTARRFLASRAAANGGGTGAEGLDATPVIAFLLAEARRGLSPGTVQGRVAELRSLLRFLHLSGVTRSSLAGAVPPVPGWKDAAVPGTISLPECQALLGSCDRSRPKGKRDFAILTVIARLGLRAGEVGALKLGDIDWRGGELAVHGKAGRDDRMPLSHDVGEAIATYVAEARPCAGSDALFLTVAAPPRPLGSSAVSEIVWRQCRAAGLAPMRAHRLRHSLATNLLAHGMKLTEIAEVLRQRDLATTAVYAKVDYATLRELALPWPGAR